MFVVSSAIIDNVVHLGDDSKRMGVNETVRANQSLGEYDLPVTGCLVNRVTPELDHPFLQRRRSEEQGHISELEETLDIPVTTMELFDSEVQGLERLRTYGRLLYGEPSQLDEELGPTQSVIV